jgi:hypothetical protein
VKLESTRIIDIEKFVPRSGIDRLYWDTPCHLVPKAKRQTRPERWHPAYGAASLLRLTRSRCAVASLAWSSP